MKDLNHGKKLKLFLITYDDGKVIIKKEIWIT